MDAALTEERMGQISALNEIALRRGQTLAEMALAWLLRDEVITSVLIGVSRPAQVLDNAKALRNISFTPEELAKRIENGDQMTLVDVREPHERAIMRFPNAIVIPIGQLARRKNELNPEIDTIFICREGKRSILAINTLREAGYAGPMYNLKGGIEAMKDIIFSHEGAWL